MKQKIYIKLFEGAEPLVIKEQGDWIDLKTRVDIHMKSPFANTLSRVRKKDEQSLTRNVEFEHMLIPLGVGMILPKGMEAHVLPRSSTYSKWKIIMWNSEGIIDYTYQGEADEWKFPAIAFDDVNIPAGTSIAQFKIVPSQNATWWQKLKWLLSSGVEIHYVDKLNDVSRGGIGSTGDK